MKPCPENCLYRVTQEDLAKRNPVTAISNNPQARILTFYSTDPNEAGCEAPGQEDYAVCTNMQGTQTTCDRSPNHQPTPTVTPTRT